MGGINFEETAVDYYRNRGLWHKISHFIKFRRQKETKISFWTDAASLILYPVWIWQTAISTFPDGIKMAFIILITVLAFINIVLSNMTARMLIKMSAVNTLRNKMIGRELDDYITYPMSVSVLREEIIPLADIISSPLETPIGKSEVYNKFLQAKAHLLEKE